MSLRLRCRSCQAAFVTSKDQVGQSVECPKCGAPQVVPRPKPTAEALEHVEAGPALQRIKAHGLRPRAPLGKPVGLHRQGRKERQEEGSPRTRGSGPPWSWSRS